MARNDCERLFFGPKERLKRDLLRFGDDTQDARDVGPQLVYTGDDFGGTGFFPLRLGVVRLVRAALRFFLLLGRHKA